MTAVFTAIQSLSTITEKFDPVRLAQFLNKYLTMMTNILIDNLGTIDKYEGDAIIAFFGAPTYREDHAVMACRSALAMKVAEREMNAKIKGGTIKSFTALYTDRNRLRCNDSGEHGF
jgi:adenylate cyclase